MNTPQGFIPGPALTELEHLLETADPLPGIRSLAQPHELEFLFQIELGLAVRGGPADGRPARAAPAQLLGIAQRAAAAGVVSLSTPLRLRGTLRSLERDLHVAGAWDARQPLWWAPLPSPTMPEELWESFSQRRDTPLVLPRRTAVAEAFAGEGAPRYMVLEELLASALTKTLHAELEGVLASGRLTLEREGVGETGELSTRRSDLVTYVNGCEPWLLEAAPSVAVLVQWGLFHFARRWTKSVGETAHAPRHAMLARYPAPSAGYAPHLDNPGGTHDNGRAVTLVIYLNAPEAACAGGEIALWPAGGSTESEPAATVAPRGGSAVCFDAHRIAHQVRPLDEGPARWALTFWFNETPQVHTLPPAPRIGLTDVLLPVAAPPLPDDRALFHELNDETPSGRILVRPARRFLPGKPRVGIVSTVYRGDGVLDAWCEHHFELGVDHIALVFDLLEEPAEAEVAERLRERHGAERLTIWGGSETAERWHALPRELHWDDLLHWAPSGFSSYAVASRQTLNASVVLEAVRDGELGGEPLDWLLHLDVDELFHLEGAGRGGATLEQHFAAAEFAGLKLIRYVNHELLLPGGAGRPRFKLNPRLAAARLGRRGWAKFVEHLDMASTGPRPYFHGYHNGKSAVAVTAALAAAGVHGWTISESCTPAMCCYVAGPSVLHFHFTSPAVFRRKYLAIATSTMPEGPRLFEPSPTEEKAVELIRRLEREGAGDADMARRLDELHERITTFSDAEAELLQEAGLLVEPRLRPLAARLGV